MNKELTTFFQKQEEIPVEITPKDPSLQLLDSFSQLTGLHQHLVKAIQKVGYVKATPVQKYVLPLVRKGRDVMACAQTGSGKTAAFLLEPINRLLMSNYRSRDPAVLVLAPTRELATQIHAEGVKFTNGTQIGCGVVYGGTEYKESFAQLAHAQILVATPGRLNDLAERNKVSLRSVQFFILDEADRMLDMGFEPQIREIVTKRGLPRKRHTIMCSATFPPDVQHMATEFMQQYTFVAVGRVGGTASTITQKVIWVEDEKKTSFLLGVLMHQLGLTLVFVNTKQAAMDVERFLGEQDIATVCIHGDRTQQQRESALADFKSGKTKVLVATDVAARGLDIPNVELVILYDMSMGVDDYVHRVGRTGRIGKRGLAITFWNSRNKGNAPELCHTLKEVKQPIPSWLEGQAISTGNYDPNESQSNKYGGQDIRSRTRGGFDKNKDEAKRWKNFQDNAYGGGSKTNTETGSKGDMASWGKGSMPNSSKANSLEPWDETQWGGEQWGDDQWAGDEWGQAQGGGQWA